MATQRAVAAKSFGSNIVGIVGVQPMFGSKIDSPLSGTPLVPNTAGGMLDKIIEFRPPYTLMPMQEFYLADRMKGNPSPDDMVEGMKYGGGVVHFYASALQGAFWLNQLLQGTVVSMPFLALADPVLDGVTLSAATPYTTFTDDIQPKNQLAAVTVDPVPPSGLTSVQLTLTVGSAVSGDTPITLIGRDLNNSQLRETVTILDGQTTVKTRRWYSELKTLVSPKAVTGLTITGNPELYDHVVSLARDFGEGLSFEVREGSPDLPITYSDMFVTGGSVVLENVARMFFRVFAHQVFPRESMSGVYGVATDITSFGRFVLNQIPKWGMSLEIESEDYSDMNRVYPVEIVGFNLNQTLSPPSTSNAESFFYPKIVRQGNRDVNWNAVVDHTLEANFDQFVGGPRFKSIITAVSKPFGGRYSGMVFEAPRTQMISFPRRIANNLGQFNQMISGRATGISAAGNDEGKMRVINAMMTL